MWGHRWGRVAFVVLSAVGSIGPPAPASAATLETVALVAAVTNSRALNWPCITTSKLCPATFPGLVGIQTGPKGEPDVDLHPGGNRVTTSISSTACALTGANVQEGSKAPVEAGACTVAASGTTTGFCGLSETQVTGTLAGPTGGVGSSQSRSMLLELTDVGGVVYISGIIAKAGNLGNVHGVGTLEAVPTPGAPPGNSCLAKTATRFTLATTLAVKVVE
jgi:hypothetical protein